MLMWFPLRDRHHRQHPKSDLDNLLWLIFESRQDIQSCRLWSQTRSQWLETSSIVSEVVYKKVLQFKEFIITQRVHIFFDDSSKQVRTLPTFIMQELLKLSDSGFHDWTSSVGKFLQTASQSIVIISLASSSFPCPYCDDTIQSMSSMSCSRAVW